MIDTFTGSVTMFDVIVFVVVLLSALMSLSRGFFRELITVLAMFAAVAAAYFSHKFFRDGVAGMLPADTASRAADVIVISLAFLIVFVAARMLGRQYAFLIQGSDEIGILDRLAGIAFGIARGIILAIITVWLLTILMPADQIPEFISESATYPIFEDIASAINASAPQVADEIEQRRTNLPT